jgi:hypothetical protein
LEAGSVKLDYRYIGVGLTADQQASVALAVVQGNSDRPCIGYDVVAGQNIPILMQDDSRTNTHSRTHQSRRVLGSGFGEHMHHGGRQLPDDFDGGKALG